MTILQAKRYGVHAFRGGLDRAPARNAEFTKKALKDSSRFIELASGYLHGWDVANLAEDAPPDMPSVIELKEIMS